MHYNSARLPLLLEIGLVASQASFADWLDKQHPTAIEESRVDRGCHQSTLSMALWGKAEALVRKLVCMDVHFNCTPTNNPLLTEYGLIEHYRDVRCHLDDPDIPFDPWADLAAYQDLYR
ncbi:hypothetical protein [Pseudomonas syringae]|uniref:hypothetical protein n=1 Tax=Pseudomonas syringae TaxID=317 RepID=UPI0018E5D99C|nr:hypothetical protein [Pseudomonas syringae]MBI6749018.1 hypothetical protein [Pseudomonas syringae]MBI6771058.1 hypothetical protein [Pseudomonas syringae]MBI6776115.1 hypothetical protein [Pseudomonas syringae]MBI6792346.1 hypothetical protein [Pseudomonas syringae]MBI6802837.1 hypothetical protein [Pseudomonas syringae]